MSRVKMIDPPHGWLYGFPKPYTPEPGQSMKGWLLMNGYPKKFVEELVYVRTYYVEGERAEPLGD